MTGTILYPMEGKTRSSTLPERGTTIAKTTLSRSSTTMLEYSVGQSAGTLIHRYVIHVPDVAESVEDGVTGLVESPADDIEDGPEPSEDESKQGSDGLSELLNIQSAIDGAEDDLNRGIKERVDLPNGPVENLNDGLGDGANDIDVGVLDGGDSA